MERYTQITPGAFGLTPGRIVKAEEFSAAADARALIAAAHDEAERIVAKAKELREAERQRGFEEGQEQARLAMAEQMTEAVGKVNDYLTAVENDMVALVSRALERIADEIGHHEIVVRIVKKALAALRNEKQLTLRVAHEQVTHLRQRLDDILSDYPLVSELQIVGDGRLSAASCIIESEIGVIDASLDGQIDALRRGFEKAFTARRQAQG